MHEGEMAPAVRAHLEQRGYRVWVDPDRRSYFDVVARREAEVALVELKVADWRKVHAQAIKRRGYADWVAVALPTEARAQRIADRATSPIGQRVGVWWVADGAVHELRAARLLYDPGTDRPFPEHRASLNAFLDLLESGALPPEVEWEGPPGRRADRRGVRDYRLEEF